MSENFTDEDFNSMAAEMEKEATQGTFQSPYWKPAKEGVYQLRIITPLKQFNEKLFYEHHKMHYINNRAYFCLNQQLLDKNGEVHEQEACPICAKSKQLYSCSAKGTEEWDTARILRAKDRYVARVIVRGKTDKDGNLTETKPEFWEFGSKIHEYFFNQIKLKEAGNFLSLKDGRDYNLSKKGTGRNSDYSGSSLSVRQTAVFQKADGTVDADKCKALMAELPKMQYNQLVEFCHPNELKESLAEFLNAGQEQTPEQAFMNPQQTSSDPFEDQIYGGSSSVAPAAAPAKEEANIDDLLAMI